MIPLRPGISSDLPAIADLLIRSWRTHYRDFLPVSMLDGLQLEQQINRHARYMEGNAIYWVAEDEEKLAGFASFGPGRGSIPAREAELYTIYVESTYQGQGIGMLLLDRILLEAQSHYDSISVLVMAPNPFRGFYEKQGFVKVREEEMDLGETMVMNLVYQKRFESSGKR